jgi:hypothetical protein
MASRQPARRFLAITCGVSGSGKSTLAEALAAATRSIRIRSDVERKRLFGLAPGQSSRNGALAATLYGPEAGERTFTRLEELAAQIVGDGFAVIVDATFIRRGLRERFRALADRLGVPFHILRCDAPVEELRRRVLARERQGRDASEAGPEVLEAQLASAELPVPASEPGTIVVTDAAPGTIERLGSMLL